MRPERGTLYAKEFASPEHITMTHLPIGFNNQMQGYFLTLCLAYCLYAVGNVNILLLMYFADYKGTKKLAKHFAILTVVFSLISQFLDPAFLGYPFLISALVLFIESGQEIDKYTSNLLYHFLGSQAMVSKKDVGYFEKWTERLDNLQKRWGNE